MDAESFDHYASTTSTSTGVASRWNRSDLSSSVEESLQTGRFGGQALRVGVVGATNPRAIAYTLAIGDTAAPEFRASFAFKRNTGEHNPSFLGVSLSRGYDRHLGLRFLVDRSIQIGTGNQLNESEGMAATVGTTDVDVFSLDIWHTCNIRGLIHPSDGWIEIMIDGHADKTFMFSGIDTEGVSGQPNITHFGISASGNGPGSSTLNATLDIDDVVIELGENSSHLPECRIQQLKPNSDGGTLDLTPSTGSDHFAMVDEVVVSTADYLSGTNDGDHDLLGCEDISVIPASVVGVQVVGWAAKTDSATRAWFLGVVSGVTTQNGDSLPLTTSPLPAFRFIPVDPDTGIEWTASGINALELKPTCVVP